jgi:hypothetical protein
MMVETQRMVNLVICINILALLKRKDKKNLQLFKAWVGNWTLKRWPEITKEELDGIKVKY